MIESLAPRSLGLLANRENSYSFSFTALQKISSVNVVKYVAEVNYGEWPMQKVGNVLCPEFMKLLSLGMVSRVGIGW